MNIFVGSLSYDVSESELREKFEEFGKVSSAKIIMDKYTERSKGFGFVEMDDNQEAKNAIEELNGFNFKGRTMVVNEARKRENKSRNNFGGFGGGQNRGGRRY